MEYIRMSEGIIYKTSTPKTYDIISDWYETPGNSQSWKIAQKPKSKE